MEHHDYENNYSRNRELHCTDNRTRLRLRVKQYEYDNIIAQIAKAKNIDLDLFREETRREQAVQKPVYSQYLGKVKRYTEFGRKRSDLEMIILTILQYLKRLLAHLKELAERKASAELQKQIDMTEKQVKDLEKSLELMEKLNVEKISDVSSMKKKTGHDRWNAKKGAEQLQSNIETLQELIDHREVPKSLAEASPMAPIQRQMLFTLMKDTGYRVYANFNDVSAGQGAGAIDFLEKQKGTLDEPDPDEIPALLQKGYRPAAVTADVLQGELHILEQKVKQYEKDVERLNAEYKDLVFLDKTCHETKDEYNKIKKQQKDREEGKDQEQAESLQQEERRHEEEKHRERKTEDHDTI